MPLLNGALGKWVAGYKDFAPTALGLALTDSFSASSRKGCGKGRFPSAAELVLP